MIGLLGQIAENAPESDPFIGRNRLRRLLQQLESPAPRRSAERTVELYTMVGMEHQFLDELEEGIEALEKARELLDTLPRTEVARRLELQVMFQLAVSYMRFGETQNCCLRSDPDSCIVPIQGGGIHTRPEGSRNAIRYLLEFLDETSVNTKNAQALDQTSMHLAARWLLNIAYMTIDEYPDGVPKKYLVDPGTFESEVDFPRFRNIAKSVGVDVFDGAGGSIVEDFDGDGFLDIMCSTWDTTGQLHLFKNGGDGSFEDVTDESGLTGLFGGFHIVQADYDNDGDADVLVVRGTWRGAQGKHPNSLLRNNGDGTFTDVSFVSGIAEDGKHYPTKTAAWADYDHDCFLDVFIGNESNKELRVKSQLFHNNGDGTFTDVAEAAGLGKFFFAMGSAWGDFDGDRYPDLYVSAGANKLYRNNRDGTFTNVAAELDVNRPRNSFPVWFWDYNNDGALDIFVATSTGGGVGMLTLFPTGVGTSQVRPALRGTQKGFERNMASRLMCLFEGDGKGGFREVAQERNLTYPAQVMGCNFGDLDNDGYLDFYLGTGDTDYHELRPNLMFINPGGRGFVNVTMAGGFGHLQKGHGISFADLDHDGDQDVYAQMGGAWKGDRYHNALFENPGFGNRWTCVKLIGTRSNRCGIGARISVEIVEDGGTRWIRKYVTTGSSFGANPLRQTIGLGKAEKIVRLEVFWPTSDTTQVFTEVPLDSFLEITEDSEELSVVERPAFELGR